MYRWKIPRSNEHLNPRLLLYSHSLFTILNAMSSYGGPALTRKMHVSPCRLPSGAMAYVGAFVLSIRSG